MSPEALISHSLIKENVSKVFGEFVLEEDEEIAKEKRKMDS